MRANSPCCNLIANWNVTQVPEICYKKELSGVEQKRGAPSLEALLWVLGLVIAAVRGISGLPWCLKQKQYGRI
jgi:hypothetical protein